MSGQSVELANQPQATQDDLEQAGVFFAGLQISNGAFRNISPAVLGAYVANIVASIMGRQRFDFTDTQNSGYLTIL